MQQNIKSSIYRSCLCSAPFFIGALFLHSGSLIPVIPQLLTVSGALYFLASVIAILTHKRALVFMPPFLCILIPITWGWFDGILQHSSWIIVLSVTIMILTIYSGMLFWALGRAGFKNSDRRNNLESGQLPRGDQKSNNDSADQNNSIILQIDGHDQGPYSMTHVMTLLRQNDISLDTMCWRPNFNSPQPLRMQPECLVKSQVRYAPLWRRLFAAIIDDIIFIPIITLMPTLMLSAKLKSILLEDILIGSAIFTYTLIYLYHILMHSRYGQTWGKMAMSIKVIHANETTLKISLPQAFLRECLSISITLAAFLYNNLRSDFFHSPAFNAYSSVSTLINVAAFIWGFVALIVMLTNKRRRAVHDFIANTVVIRSPE
jgi:uncharacterized RDD family membrane protein YckC